MISTENINLIDTSQAHFYMDDGGFLCLTYKDEEYKQISATRLLPFTNLEEYISITCSEKEVGIIRTLSDLAEAERHIVRSWLGFVYYSPPIEKIISVKEKAGYLYFDTVIGGIHKRFCVGDFQSNLLLLNQKEIVIVDVEGNRYMIDDIATFDPKSLQKLDIFL